MNKVHFFAVLLSSLLGMTLMSFDMRAAYAWSDDSPAESAPPTLWAPASCLIDKCV